MYWSEIKRIAAIAGFVTGMLCLLINLLMKRPLLESALLSFFVLILSSFIYLACLQAVGRILAAFLLEQQKAAAELERKQRIEEEKRAKEEREEATRKATAELEKAKKEQIAQAMEQQVQAQQAQEEKQKK